MCESARPRAPRALLAAAFFAALLLLVPAAAAAAAVAAADEFIVASSADDADGNPGDGDCDPDDDGSESDCTLRAALEEADAEDAEGGRHQIGFSESMTIQPLYTSLPAVTERVAINATADFDCEEAPAIAVVLDGQGTIPTGLRIGGEKSLVCGLVVQRFSSAGVVVTAPSTLVGQSRIGTDAAGTTAMGNVDGVRVSADEVLVESSLISGNFGAGVKIDSGAQGVVVRGNRIGTDAAGTAAVGNAHGIQVTDGNGVEIGGSLSPGAQATDACDDVCNVISGNAVGVRIQSGATGNHLRGNYIGLGPDGALEIGNSSHGVVVSSGAAGNTIGGTAAGTGNVISGNGTGGVELTGTGTGNKLQGNYIGTDAAGTAARPNGSYGVGLFGGTAGNTVGGTAAGAGNVISGNADHGVYISAGDENEVSGNLIGPDATGAAALGLQEFGVLITNGVGNTIGGAGPAARNVISGNLSSGLRVLGAGSEDNVVAGNYLGLAADGTTPLGNEYAGIQLLGGTGTRVGGVGAGEGNVASANGTEGIRSENAIETTVVGNYVGTDATGLLDRGNAQSGIVAFGSEDVVGEPGAGNVISGNGTRGITLGSVSEAPLVQANLIGLGVDGATPLGNDSYGIYASGFEGGAIGGSEPGEGNVISGNGDDGILLLLMEGLEIEGNRIGTTADGSAARGNAAHGVDVVNSSGVAVGGVAAGAGNEIAANGQDGVQVVGSESVGNLVLGNSIHDNGDEAGDLGIDLVGISGVTANDHLDADTGANRLQNFPVLKEVETGMGETTISAVLESEPEGEYRIEFFATPSCDDSGQGEGATFLGALDGVSPDKKGIATFEATLPATAPEQQLTATATDLDPADPDGTSEFSACMAIPAAPVPPEEEPEEPVTEQPGPPALTPPATPPIVPVAPTPPSPSDQRPRCMGKPATIVGTAQRDVLKGTRKRDVIVARGGNDKILAFAGNDLVCAGSGKDVVKAGSGNDRVAAGAGPDRVFGQAGRDRVHGQAGNDRLFGQGAKDRLFGNAGRDLLNGGPRRDLCRGGRKDRLRRCELPRKRS